MRSASRWFMAALAGGAIAWIVWALLSPWVSGLGAVATLVGLTAVLIALDRTARWAEDRGWIYYRKRQGSWGAVGAAMSEVHAIYQPGQRFVKQVHEDAHVHEEDDDQGDRPKPGVAPGARR